MDFGSISGLTKCGNQNIFWSIENATQKSVQLNLIVTDGIKNYN